MGKWFGNIITTLVILVITSVAAGLLKGPIEDLAAANRLQAQIQMAPWVPKASLSNYDDIPKSDKNRLKQFWNDIEDDYKSIEKSSKGEDLFRLLRVNLENSSSKEIKNINFRFDEAYLDDDAVYVDAEGSAHPVKNVDRFELPDMKPGDRIVVYIWGTFHPLITPPEFKSYSSEGPFRTSFDWPNSKDFEYQSGIARFINDWAETVGIWAAIFLLIGLGISAGVASDYYKNLLKNPEAYNREHERFSNDGKAFVPDWSGVQTAASHLEAVKRGLLPKGREKEESSSPTSENE